MTDRITPIATSPRRDGFPAAFLLLTDLRNAVAHSRELVTFEREIMSGISTQLRTRVAEYRTRAEPVTAHYPLIESAVDGSGRAGTPGIIANLYQHPFPRLEVGDRLTFRLRAIDPRRRELHWRVYTDQGSGLIHSSPVIMGDPPPDAVGSPAEIEVTVMEDHVGEEFYVRVWLIHGGGKWHRHHSYDDVVTFWYAVNPPMD